MKIKANPEVKELIIKLITQKPPHFIIEKWAYDPKYNSMQRMI